MASSRSPSPGEGSSSPPGTPLTPRSKLKALFADMSASSDDDASPTRKQSRPSSIKAGQSPTVRRNTPTFTKSPVRDDDESSEEEVVRPRGRLASRMQAQDAVQQHQEESEPEARPEDARERVKRMLAKAAEPQKTGEKDGNSDADMASGEEDDEVVTFRQHRRLKQKSRRSPTPASKTATPQREDSPGMFVSPTKEPSPLPSIADGEASDSDADLPPASTKNHRFMALVAKKREELRAKEAEEERKREARLARQAEEDEQLMDDGESSDITDDEGGRKLTQEASGSRPAARKASKKALEEMNRETQRMSRSLQLAHEAKTRKKITKASLFERFNFKPAGYTAPAPPAEEKHAASSSRPGTPASDVEMKDADTPPSSPPVVGKEPVGPGEAKEVSALQAVSEAIPAGTNTNDDDDEALPTLDDVLAQAYSSQPKPLDKGKGKAVDVEIPPQPHETKPAAHKRQFRVKLPQLEANLVTIASDEEDELVITKPKKSKIDAIFDRVPAKRETESRSMQALRYLAQVDGSPGRKASHGARRGAAKEKESMTVAELQAALQQRAREQAKLERDRRLEMLKAKGVHVQTTEEREQEMNEIEDIVARARREAEEIMQREREAAKAEKRANGEEGAAADPLAWDDSDASDDEEYREEPSEIELSGSEEDEEMAEKRAGLIDEAAESADESEDGEAETVEQDAKAADSDEEMVELPTRKARRNKLAAILSDDDDEEVQPSEAKTPKPKTSFFKSPSANQTTDSPHVPTSVLRSATKTFIPGLPVTNGDPAGLGLTQIFAGTMDDSQASAMMGSPSQPMPTFEPKPTFDSFPDSNFSQTVPDGADMILNSQPTQKETQGEESQGVQIQFTQSQMHGFDSLLREQDATQTSDFLVLTQDGGFQNYSPLKQRFVEPPPSTIETVAVDPSQQPDPSQHESSPLMHKKGKLRRKIQMAAVPESDEEMEPTEALQPEEEEDEFGFGTTTTTTAFSVMKDAAAAAEEKKKRKALEAFSKKKSKAKDMVEDQAEESEDEYAGLGGADGEDSDDESTASVKDMIDDETKGSRGDDAKLAGFYADRERASDEKQVEKLFRDITSGMLRRKRAAGADFDGLSDEDDGGEARRRMKRRQFQKMQRALFADERVSKVAENPRNSAFLRTIEDRGSDDEDMDFLFEQPSVGGGGGGGGVDSQRSSDGESQQVVAIPDSQPSASTSAAASAPARRAKGRDKRPATLGEIRESLSNLLDDPGESVIPATATDDEEEHESSGDERERERLLPATASSMSSGSSNKENSNPRRRQHGAVVDRISLKRAGSSSVSAAGGGGAAGRMAFAAPAAASSSSAGGFRVPALLRRATTNNSLAGSSSATSAPGGGFGEEGHRAARSKASSSTNGGGAAGSGGGGAKKKSGINYFARENERRAAMAEKEKRREARKWKGAEGRGAVVGGLFGAGKFE
ncbi:uncharacterized protein E0L32_003509 [Thyridium curvatum]|uniref:DNA replication checkpoint mediator MRC1 domain-containing protein n=1 Tax=Thyridium curvatum TaxID=1093900 RepID=A0A507BAP5_9PEZI|nr:uncharacterized protein E0L32_003509 [Thyridium curvatum]TPX16947.1 hypothetical protein E0L32_003509 [Thyridium curvatum]